jgi:hypothetical protein
MVVIMGDSITANWDQPWGINFAQHAAWVDAGVIIDDSARCGSLRG